MDPKAWNQSLRQKSTFNIQEEREDHWEFNTACALLNTHFEGALVAGIER